MTDTAAYRIAAYRKLVLLCLLGLASASGAIERWQVGGTGEGWQTIGALEGLAVENSVLVALGVDPAVNAARSLRARGGEVSSPQTRDDLTPVLTDGRSETDWRVPQDRRPDGTSLIIDLGAILPINRVRYLGNPDEFLRAYEVFIHDGDPSQLRNGVPVAYTNLVRRNLEQDDPVIELEFPLQFVRFIRLVSRSTQSFIMQDIEIFGRWFCPHGSIRLRSGRFGHPGQFWRYRAERQPDRGDPGPIANAHRHRA